MTGLIRYKFNDDNKLEIDTEFTKDHAFDDSSMNRDEKVISAVDSVFNLMLFPVLFIVYGFSWYLLLPLVMRFVVHAGLMFFPVFIQIHTMINCHRNLDDSPKEKNVYFTEEFNVPLWPTEITAGLNIGIFLMCLLKILGY